MENNFELKKIMVCLDLSEMDETLIRFTSFIARIMHSDRIYFMHVAQSLDMPNEIRRKYPDLFAPVDEAISQSIAARVKQFFKSPEDCTTEIEVREGNPEDQILKTARQKDVDLLILGKKVGLEGEGILVSKLAKIVNRSVLIVPETLPTTVKQILVPVDFSRHSLVALKQAIKIDETTSSSIHISCQHVYQLPMGWHKTGKSETEFSEIMKGHAENDYKKFLQKLGKHERDIPCTFTLVRNGNPAKAIYRHAIKEQVSMIIMGSKGRTAAASVLMGSTAEKLAHYDKNIPMLIVKDKKENISFLEALFKI